MKNIIKRSLAVLMLVPALAVAVSTVVLPASVSAADLTMTGGANSAKGADQPENLFDQGGMFQTITNVLLFIVGAIAVIMLIIGGIKYTVSGGDQSAVQSAKNTILYAIVGIVVAILAFAVVNWVVGSFANN